MKYDIELIDSLGKRIEVLQQLPSKGSVFPTVILVSGIGADLHEFGLFDDIVSVLNKNGMQTIRFNFAGMGKSEGVYAENTLFTQAQQLQDVIEYTIKDRFSDKERIGIFAHGLGVTTTLATLPQPQIKTFLLSGSMADPHESLGRWFRGERGYKPDAISERVRSDKTVTKVGPLFWKSLEHTSFIKQAELMTGSVLFLHGSNDRVSKPWESHEYFNTVPTRKKFVMVRGANRGYTKEARPVVLDIIRDWFLKELAVLSS